MIQYLSKVSPAKLQGVAILRLDFNTEDDWRMKASLPTLQLLLKHARAIVILSHKGRPLGFQRDLGLKKCADQLEALIKKPVTFFPSFNFLEIKEEIEKGKPKPVYMLENLRFMPGEAKNDAKFAENLSLLGDYYVNDAFAVSHRANASIAAITNFLPSYAGLELQSEITNLGKVIKQAKRPLVMIFGGAKIEDKLNVIRFFKKKAYAFLIGGALANTLLYLKGVPMGKSIYEKEVGSNVRLLLGYKNIFLPLDYRTDDTAILDIGVETQQLFEDKIRKAKTIVWNGPLGLIEREAFARGTKIIAKAVAENKRAFSVVGGGETVMALKKYNLAGEFSFISTGGGAMLDFLAGKKLPGIEALNQEL